MGAFIAILYYAALALVCVTVIATGVKLGMDWHENAKNKKG